VRKSGIDKILRRLPWTLSICRSHLISRRPGKVPVWQGQFQLRFWTGSGVNSQSATENSPSPPKEHVWSSVCHTGTGQLSSIETFFL
jgi:hypothetical protein